MLSDGLPAVFSATASISVYGRSEMRATKGVGGTNRSSGYSFILPHDSRKANQVWARCGYSPRGFQRVCFSASGNIHHSRLDYNLCYCKNIIHTRMADSIRCNNGRGGCIAAAVTAACEPRGVRRCAAASLPWLVQQGGDSASAIKA